MKQGKSSAPDRRISGCHSCAEGKKRILLSPQRVTGSDPIAAANRKVLKIQGFLLFCHSFICQNASGSSPIFTKLFSWFSQNVQASSPNPRSFFSFLFYDLSW